MQSWVSPPPQVSVNDKGKYVTLLWRNLADSSTSKRPPYIPGARHRDTTCFRRDTRKILQQHVFGSLAKHAHLRYDQEETSYNYHLRSILQSNWPVLSKNATQDED